MINAEFSGATIVIFIALGALVLVLLFIFAKRQIMRFTLRSRRGPHVPIGHSAPRWMRNEIERRLDLVGRVKKEPKLLPEGALPDTANTESICRMQALDDVKILEIQLKASDPKANRMPGDNLRYFLMAQLSGVLKGIHPKMVHQLCDLYEQARYSPDAFGASHLESYRKLVSNLVQVAQSNGSQQHAASSPKLGKLKRTKDATTSV